MKRSEVLLKLKRFYGCQHVMVEQGYDTPDRFMENVLTLIEDLGMQPPKRFNAEEYDFNKEYLAEAASADYNVPRYVNKWEPENEKK